MRHPAKYSDPFIPIFAKILCENKSIRVLDPFAGTGKIGAVQDYGFQGEIFANEIEREWLDSGEYNLSGKFYDDAEFSDFGGIMYDAVCTSPTYGNRMADHHNAKDGSRRNTYTHCLGRNLSDGNTGKMQWGKDYREKHSRIYENVIYHLKKGGIFILNVGDHIRKGEEIKVSEWHKNILLSKGMRLDSDTIIATKGLRQGKNRDLRVGCEHIYLFRKI